MDKIQAPMIGEILLQEFMVPFGVSAYRLAKDIDVPYSRIRGILDNRIGITADTSIRLGAYFGVSDFLSLQTDIDLRKTREKLEEVVAKIKTHPNLLPSFHPKNR